MYKILDMDKNNIVDEQYLRSLLFDYEIEDILQNRDDYINGYLDINVQKRCIKNALLKDMTYVIDTLETSWNVPIEEIESEEK